MKKKNTWQSKLTKKELRHLRVDAGVTTLSAAKRNFELHVKMRGETDVEPCWDCKNIARKLGLPV
jgi:hypothetical protein